ncbi:signal peptidase II [Bryobacter aggregatus]|uniref:signal peptidase II n=1 Tax=Bryobacter aggregatus TaxID=360054 RepID=UPI0004E0AF8A|nr:signal peptidase II [Bryobacter aggregatus]
MGARRALAFAIVAAVFLLDRGTKYWIETKVSLYDTIEVIPSVFNIVHARNRGAAFGILNTSPEWVRLLVLVGLALCILAMIASMLWQATRRDAPSSLVNRLSLALVFGGAIGNLYDRILKGSVTDFLQVFLGSYEWPSFNVADSAITVGATLMAIDLIFLSRKQESQNNAPETR